MDQIKGRIDDHATYNVLSINDLYTKIESGVGIYYKLKINYKLITDDNQVLVSHLFYSNLLRPVEKFVEHSQKSKRNDFI